VVEAFHRLRSTLALANQHWNAGDAIFAEKDLLSGPHEDMSEELVRLRKSLFQKG
jgi:hypothetical protein